MKQYIVIWRKIDEEQGIARLSKRRRAGYGGNKMKLCFEVERRRGSVTQGEATVLLNGQEVVTFGDKIELCPKGTRRGAEYGENIDGWQSVKSDADFLRGVLFPFYLHKQRIEERIAEILNREDKITELTD